MLEAEGRAHCGRSSPPGSAPAWGPGEEVGEWVGVVEAEEERFMERAAAASRAVWWLLLLL